MSDCFITNYNLPPIHQNNKYNYSVTKKTTQSSTDTISFRSNQNKNNQPKKLKDIIKEIKNIIIQCDKKQTAKMLGEIFRREISIEESENILRQYKQIINIEDKEEYIKQLFNQIKKDYGWKDLNLAYQLNKTDKINSSSTATGGYIPLGLTVKKMPNGDDTLEFNPGIIEIRYDRSKKNIFITMMHEFQHCKQHELAYRTDKKKFLDALIKDRFLRVCSKQEQETEEIKKYIEMYKESINKYYGSVWDKLPSLQKGSKEYELGLKYIDNLANYVESTQDKKVYYKQILEDEAYNASFLARYIFKKAQRSK